MENLGTQPAYRQEIPAANNCLQSERDTALVSEVDSDRGRHQMSISGLYMHTYIHTHALTNPYIYITYAHPTHVNTHRQYM